MEVIAHSKRKMLFVENKKSVTLIALLHSQRQLVFFTKEKITSQCLSYV